MGGGPHWGSIFYEKYIYINFPESPEPFAFGSQTGTLSRQTQLQDFTIPPLSVHALLTTKNLEGDISETIRAIRVPLVSKRIFNAVPTFWEKKKDFWCDKIPTKSLFWNVGTATPPSQVATNTKFWKCVSIDFLLNGFDVCLKAFLLIGFGKDVVQQYFRYCACLNNLQERKTFGNDAALPLLTYLLISHCTSALTLTFSLSLSHFYYSHYCFSWFFAL